MALALPLHEIVEKSSNPLLKIHPTWERIQLAEIAEILNGFAFKSTKFNKSKGFPLLRIRDILNNSTACLYDGPYDSAYIVESGEYIIGMDGNFNFAKWEGPAALLNQRVCKITIQSNKFIPKFLEYVLPSYLKAINENTSSVTVKHLSSKSVGEIPIPLPPLPEQHRIVTKLEALLAQVNRSKDHLAEVPPLIKRFRQSVLAAACSGRLTEDWRREHPGVEPARKIIEAISQRRLKQANRPTKKQKIKDIYSHREEQDSDLLPQSWEYVAMDKLCESFQYGTSKKSMPVGKIPVLRMGNIQNGEIDWNDLVYTSDVGEIEKYRLEPETVLFNRTNSPELVGKTAIYRGENPAIFAGYLIRINNYKELDSEYLNYCLNTTYTKERCLKVKTDGVSQSNINAQKLGKFEITFCPLEEQQEIVRRVYVLFKNSGSIEDHYKKANAQVDNLTQSILARAFRGELVPQDPRDEPASILLERIKHERAELKAKKKTQKRKSKTLLDFN